MAGKNYASGQPVGNNQMLFNISTPAPFKALKQYYAENGAVSSVVTLTENTTAVEIAAGGAAALIRWVYVSDASTAATSVIATGTSANWDHVVPANTVRRFVVPIEVSSPGIAPNASMVGARVENGLFARLAYRNAGIGSVMASEYGSSNSY